MLARARHTVAAAHLTLTSSRYNPLRGPMLESLLQADQLAVEAVAELRWSPATALFVLVSAWWVKGPLIIAAGLLRDWRARCPPVTALSATLAVLLASLASSALKTTVDRDRPPVADPGFEAAVSVPTTYSFPSGHATTAFAAAAAVALLAPGLRTAVLALAAAVAVSRVYLGVHYVLDVLAGALLGGVAGVLVALAVRALVARVAAARAVPDGA